MALKISKTLDNGLIVTDGYLKVTNIIGNKERVVYRGELAVNKQYADDNKFIKEFFISGFYIPTENNFNFIQQAYEDIKKKPEYQNAEDI